MGTRLGEGYNFWAPFIKTLGDVHKWVLCYWLKHGKRIFIESYTQSLIAQWKSSHPEQFYKFWYATDKTQSVLNSNGIKHIAFSFSTNAAV